MENKKSGMAVAALTLGIISILTSWFWYLTMPAGILAIIFGGKSAKRSGSMAAKAGIVLGIIGLSLFIFFYGAAFVLICAA